jgi:ADP-ribose pyrophosphatase YjhB (NUDIX family)
LLDKAAFFEGHVPKGGTCVSVFLLLKGKDGLLVGKITKPEVWINRFLVGPNFAPKYVASGKYVLPACHLKYGEDPADAATRVLVEEVGAQKSKLTLLHVQSHLAQDPADPENAHWDLCLVYEGNLEGEVHTPEWFSELKFVNPRELKSDDFTRGHGDVLKKASVISS